MAKKNSVKKHQPKKHHRYERTLVMIKPDGIQRGLMGEIVGRYERSGLKLVAVKMLVPTEEQVYSHYTLDPLWMKKTGEKNLKAYREKGLKPPHDDPIEQSKMILQKLKKYLTSGPIIIMVWQGAHAVSIIRKLTGGTEPLTSDVGTIRGDYVLDSYEMADEDLRAIRNLVHASGSVQEGQDEISFWFTAKEIMSYGLVQEKILYDVNIDGIPE